MMDSILDGIDVSFKWILLSLNFVTIIFVYLHKQKNKKPRQHHILFITAHPDDQCMFFRPTINGLKQSYFIHLLCLSGKGTPREQELAKACQFLGVDEFMCIGDQRLVDGMKEKWCEETIRKYAVDYARDHKIKAIFTFDESGISGHANHKSVFNAIKQIEVKPDVKESIKAYYLQSTNILRKYSGILQIFIALLKTYSWIEFSPFEAYKSMSFHQSQFVWYRRLWVFLSRYEYINTYQRAFIKIEPN